MFRHLLLLFFIINNIYGVHFSYAAENGQEENGIVFQQALKNVTTAVKNAGAINYQANCANCASVYPTTAELISTDNHQTIELTVLSEDQALAAFNALKARNDIPFGYPLDGCYARAHKMAIILEKNGIISGKAFLEGRLYVDTNFGEVGWGYHVASVVMVKKGSAIVPYVFDPSLFSTPVPQTEWKAKMLQKSKATLTREYYTNRFSYDPADRTAQYSEYPEDTLSDMNDTNKNYVKILSDYNSTQEK